jgi:hypothetical protein
MKWKSLVAPVLLLALALCNNASQAQQKNENGKSEIWNNITINAVRSGGSDDMQIDYSEDGHRYKIRLNGTKITEMYIDDKKVPETDYAKYERTVKKILEQIEKDRQQAENDRAQAEKDREQSKKDRELVNEMREQVQNDRKQAEIDREQAEKDRIQAQREREQAAKDREQAEKDRAQAAIDREKAEEDRKFMEGMLDQLVQEKLLDDRQSLTSMELDDARLVINGKEQSESVHRRYKQKYLKGTNKRIQYRSAGGNRTFTVN